MTSSTSDRSAADEIEGSAESEELVDPGAKFQFDDSDITLISSDNVSFAVHRYQLQAFSPVMRGLLRDCNQGKEIRLCDEAIESAGNIVALLELIYFAKPPSLNGSSQAFRIQEFLSLIRLLRKYECDLALNCIRQNTKILSYQSQSSSFGTFVIAAEFEDVDTCAQVIVAKGGHSWRAIPQESIGYELDAAAGDCPVFDLTGISYAHFELLPLRYAHALLRSNRITLSDKQQKSKWKLVSAEFKRLMTQQPGEH